MALTFDTNKSAGKLRESGLGDSEASAIVEVVVDATAPLVTQEHFDARLSTEMAGLRAELHRSMLMLGLGLAGFVVAVAGASLAGAALMFD